MFNEKKLFFVSDAGSTSRSVSILLPQTFVPVNTNPNIWNVKMSRIRWRWVCAGRCQQNLL